MKEKRKATVAQRCYPETKARLETIASLHRLDGAAMLDRLVPQVRKAECPECCYTEGHDPECSRA